MLSALFLDMNSYFASVEQQDRPELRNRPIIVVPVMADTTCAIAASYEAKAFGIKTGTAVWQAKQLCRNLKIVEARPEMYVAMHNRFIAALDAIMPVDKICSIDEARCRLRGDQRQPEVAIALAKTIKQAFRKDVGEYMRCSIGLAPNFFLSKVASDMQKPDGLVVLAPEDLPTKLFSLQLRDLPGIGVRMEARLQAQGVHTVEQLYERSEQEIGELWGSVVGKRWWYWLRGHDLPELPTKTQTVGHSHVLPPELRTPHGALGVLTRLVHKAAARLRNLKFWASQMSIDVSYSHREFRWQASARLGPCQDTLTMIEALAKMWQNRPPHRQPTQVGVTLSRLLANCSVTPPIFPEAQARVRLAETMDRLNRLLGRNAVYFGGMHEAFDSAPTRIAFTSIPEMRSFSQEDAPQVPRAERRKPL